MDVLVHNNKTYKLIRAEAATPLEAGQQVRTEGWFVTAIWWPDGTMAHAPYGAMKRDLEVYAWIREELKSDV